MCEVLMAMEFFVLIVPPLILLTANNCKKNFNHQSNNQKGFFRKNLKYYYRIRLSLKMNIE